MGSNQKYLFGGNRELAIQRDGEKCVVCLMTRVEHRAKYKRDITVDHIDGKGRNTPANERNHSLDNLQTLCLKCHGSKDIGKFLEKTGGKMMWKTEPYWPKIKIPRCTTCNRFVTKLGCKIHKPNVEEEDNE